MRYIKLFENINLDDWDYEEKNYIHDFELFLNDVNYCMLIDKEHWNIFADYANDKILWASGIKLKGYIPSHNNDSYILYNNVRLYFSDVKSYFNKYNHLHLLNPFYIQIQEN